MKLKAKAEHTSNGRTLINSLRAKLEIDRSDLETCLVEQAMLTFEVSEHVVTANSERDKLKLDIEQLAAQLDPEIREDLEQAEAKITEAIVANAIKDDSRMRSAQAAYLAAKENAELLHSLESAFHQRGSMLKKLAELEIKRLGLEGDVAGLERDATNVRRARGDENARKAGALRRQKFGRQ